MTARMTFARAFFICISTPATSFFTTLSLRAITNSWSRAAPRVVTPYFAAPPFA